MVSLAFITDQVYTTHVDINVDLMPVKFSLRNHLTQL